MLKEEILAWHWWPKFYSVLTQLSQHHPDNSRRSMYLAFLLFVDCFLNGEKNNPRIELDDAEKLLSFLWPNMMRIKNGEQISHFLNLFSHTHFCEYTFLLDNCVLDEHGNIVKSYSLSSTRKNSSFKTYDNFTQSEWVQVFHQHLKSEPILSETYKELSSKVTQTFVLSRYYAAYTILQKHFGTRPIRVADIGCSLGIALPIMSEEPKVLGKPDGDVHFNHGYHPLTIEQGYLVDKEMILDQKSIEWIFACMFYPNENEKLKEVADLYSKFHPKKDIEKFSVLDGKNGDARNLDTYVRLNTLDAVIINTTLYQLSNEERSELLAAVHKCLKPEGIVIISDFAVKSPADHSSTFNFNPTWFEKDEHTYRTFIMTRTSDHFSDPQEVFTFPNARCRHLALGQDYSDVFFI